MLLLCQLVICGEGVALDAQPCAATIDKSTCLLSMQGETISCNRAVDYWYSCSGHFVLEAGCPT